MATKVALVGGFGPAQVACITSWCQLGLKICFIHISDGPRLKYTLGRYSSYHHFPSNILNSEKGMLTIAKIIDDENCVAAAALSYVLSASLARTFSSIGSKVKLNFADDNLLCFLETKSIQIDLARKIGFNVLDYSLINTSDEVNNLPLEKFPIVARPNHPSFANNQFKAEFFKNREQIISYLGEKKDNLGWIVQSFINTPNLLIHGCRHSNGEHLKINAYIVDYKFKGVSQRIIPCSMPESFFLKCEKFVESAGVFGVYHFDFLLREPFEESMYLEINARLGGTTCKVQHFGYDEPSLLLQSMGVISEIQQREKKYVVPVTNKLSVIKRILSMLKGKQSMIDYPTQGFGAVLIQLLFGLLLWRDEITYGQDLDIIIDYYMDVVNG